MSEPGTRYDEIEARVKAATSAPWHRFDDGGVIAVTLQHRHTYGPGYADCVWGPRGPGHVLIADCSPNGQQPDPETIANAELIAHAPDDLLFLLLDVRALQQHALDLTDRLRRVDPDPTDRLPYILAATLVMAHDNGAINRDETEADLRARLDVFLYAAVKSEKSHTEPELQVIDAWLGSLHPSALDALCSGDEAEQKLIYQGAPPSTDKLLNDIFNVVL